MADALADDDPSPAPGLLILDLDGVLVDSEVISAEVLGGLAADASVTIPAGDFPKYWLGRSFPSAAAALRARTGAVLPEGFEAEYRRRLLARFETELRPMPGVAEVLARVPVPVCVATSSSPPRAAASLRAAGLAARLPRVFTASEVARGKPAPDLFLHAAAAMGVAPEACLVVEDSPPGLAAARAAGMASAFLAAGSHYAGDADPAAALDVRQPVFRSWDALAASWGWLR